MSVIKVFDKPLRWFLAGFCAWLAVAGIVACGTECNCDDYVPEILDALESFENSFLSRRGAHTYVEVPGAGYSGPVDSNALYLREYSDLMSHFGLYKPIMNPLVKITSDLRCGYGGRGHYTDSIRETFDCEGGFLAMQFAYVEPERVAVLFVPETEWSGGDITIGGCAVDNGDGLLASIVSLDSGKVVIDQEATLYSFWGVQAREIRRTTVEFVPPPFAGPAIDGLCWSATISPDQLTVVSFDMQSAWRDDASFDDLTAAPDLLDQPAFTSALNDVRLEMVAWFEGAPIIDESDRMAGVAWFLLWENTAAPWGTKWTRPAVVPSKRHYFRGVWLWDAAFIAAMLAQGNADARQLGRDQVRLVIDNQAPDGRFPREIWAHDAGTGFQPPGLLTWAAIELANGENDYAFIDEVYDALVANHRWIAANTDSDGDGRCEWSKEDSGMDTSPRFDNGPVEGVDLQAWMAMDARLLGRIAYLTGRDADRAAWEAEAVARLDDIRLNFWDAVDGMFYDRVVDDTAAEPFVREITPTAFLPLFVQAATEEQAATMAAHLSDPLYFDAPFGLPTVSPASEEYESDNYWRGPSWIVTNAFAIWGLDQYNLWRESNELRASTLAMIAASNTPWEYYDSQSGQGLGSPDFMWSAVFYLLLQSGELPMNYD